MIIIVITAIVKLHIVIAIGLGRTRYIRIRGTCPPNFRSIHLGLGLGLGPRVRVRAYRKLGGPEPDTGGEGRGGGKGAGGKVV